MNHEVIRNNLTPITGSPGSSYHGLMRGLKPGVQLSQVSWFLSRPKHNYTHGREEKLHHFDVTKMVVGTYYVFNLSGPSRCISLFYEFKLKYILRHLFINVLESVYKRKNNNKTMLCDRMRWQHVNGEQNRAKNQTPRTLTKHPRGFNNTNTIVQCELGLSLVCKVWLKPFKGCAPDTHPLL